MMITIGKFLSARSGDETEGDAVDSHRTRDSESVATEDGGVAPETTPPATARSTTTPRR